VLGGILQCVIRSLSVASLGRCDVTLAAVASPVTPLLGQSRTPEGQPDLQGVWSFATLTPLERPVSFAGKIRVDRRKRRPRSRRRTLDRTNADRRPEGAKPTSPSAVTTTRGTTGARKSSGPKRTSLVTDPPTAASRAHGGRAEEKRTPARTSGVNIGPADGPEGSIPRRANAYVRRRPPMVRAGTTTTCSSFSPAIMW